MLHDLSPSPKNVPHALAKIAADLDLTSGSDEDVVDLSRVPRFGAVFSRPLRSGRQSLRVS